MNSQPEEFSTRRARLLILVVLIFVAACIALANLSSEPLTTDDVGKVLQRVTVERACGWPFAWYWRRPVIRVPATTSPAPIGWAVSRYRAAYLAADVAVWLAIVLIVTFCGEWLMRKYRIRLRCRPRAVTVFSLSLAAAVTVLANLSSNTGPGQAQPQSCGWPLVWYWQTYSTIGWQNVSEWHFSAVALAGNFVIWAALFAAIVVACELLVRRHRLRLRWSLRTMLGAVGLIAVACAWFVNARERAKEADKLIALVQPDFGTVYLDSQGPAWLDLVGADRLRRRVAGVYIRELNKRVNEEDLFKRLASCPHLRFLEVEPVLIPTLDSALGDMRQLRVLGIRCPTYNQEFQLATLAAVGNLIELERLSIRVGLAGTGDLDPLAGLVNLKSLTLEVHGEIEPGQGLAAVGKLARLEHLLLRTWQISSVDLACLAGLTNLKSLRVQCTPGGASPLPALPRLESLELSEVPVGDADLTRLSAFPRLNSLCLRQTGVTAAGLASLASAPSLRELAIDEDTLTAEGLESLTAIKNLKSLHVAYVMDEPYEEDDEWSSVMLDDGQRLDVLSSGLDRLRQAIESLRRAHPGIVIDTNYGGFGERKFQRAFELAPPPGSEPAR